MLTALFRLLVAFACFSLALACGDGPAHDHGHEHSRRAIPAAPATPPTRPLVWGDLNVIHTTDSHGWLLGHQKASPPEPNYSGDFGDFASFVAHMKKQAAVSSSLPVRLHWYFNGGEREGGGEEKCIRVVVD